MSNVTFVILAAGKGTRMRSTLPKVLHSLCGMTMLDWVIAAARTAGSTRTIVVDNSERALASALPAEVEVAVQSEGQGTGAGARAAIDAIATSGVVVVLPGDVPLIDGEFLKRFVAEHESSGAAASIATTTIDDPTGYGRVVRSPAGDVTRVVETKVAGDATDAELAIKEINTGVFAFNGSVLADALGRLQSDNAQNEYYLPDALEIIREDGGKIGAVCAEDSQGFAGVNDQCQLSELAAIMRRRINDSHLRAGVTIVDPAATYIDGSVEIQPDAIIEPGVQLLGMTAIGIGARIGSGSVVSNSTIGSCAVVRSSHVDSATVGQNAKIGPFAYLRPGAQIGPRCKVGAYVEVKNSTLAEGSKVPHLSYIGDCEIGAGANVGAGSITANYDGYSKHRTVIGEGARIGVHTSFVAPVAVGDGAYTAAGSVIVSEVPADALAVARSRQKNVPNYATKVSTQEQKNGTKV